jgi:general secretion pathway protein A
VYENYYRFRRQPFSPTPDPEFLYKSAIHQRALEELLRGVRRREGMLLLTGDVGTGKTTTTRALLGLLDRDVFTALVINPFVTADELLRVLLTDFGVVSDIRLTEGVSRQSLVDTLNRFLLSLSSVGASALAVVDEAQNLDPAVLEQLRVLTALETDHQKLLQILLVGQPELKTLLETHEMRSLNQRIARRVTLGPLNREEVEHYVAFRIRLALDGGDPMFSDGALDQVHRFSGGVPREINKLCDRSLEAGFAAQSPTVDEALVAEAAAALDLTPMPALPVTIEAASEAEFVKSGRRAGLTARTKRWLAASVVVAAGIGLGVWVAVTMLGGASDAVEVGGAPLPATVEAPSPLGAGPRAGQAFRVLAGEFDTRGSAEAVAEILRRLGGEVSVAAAVGSPDRYLVWVGPYATLTAAQAMDADIKSVGLAGTRIVPDEGLSAP